ncbi:MAG: hypothetical protein ABI378_13625 [Chitinophagaceae bacterium]
MRKAEIYIMVSVIFLAQFFSSCSKKSQHSERFNALLGRWRVTYTGVDSNHNGLLDSSEMLAASPDQDQEEEYLSNGTGKGYFITGGGTYPSDFNWFLLNSDQTLRIVGNPNTSFETTKDYTFQTVTSESIIIYSISDTCYFVEAKL